MSTIKRVCENECYGFRPRQGAGTEQLAISSDSDDSTTPQQGQNGSNQGQSHAKSQGQPNGLDLPKVHVSGPSDNPDILSSDHGYVNTKSLIISNLGF